MDAYYDTGALVPLYVEEVFSPAVDALVASRHQPIPLNLLQQLEFENAARLKLFRNEIDEKRMNRILADLNEDLGRGRLVSRAVNWISTLDKARRIGERVTAKTGCRTLDLIHVAIAAEWECALFITADDRQIEAAKHEALEVVDLRDPRQWRGRDRPAPGVVEEKRTRYTAKKRKRRA